jgi:hypothetical protein
MRRFFARRPSPAMGVAFVALLAALSGTAVALPGVNTVDSGDIKNGQVKNKDIRKNAVTSKKVKNGSLTGADVKNDSLTGADINESTLGQVPSANTANTANTANSATTANSANTANTANNANSVDGLSAAKVFYNAGANSTPQTVLNFGGLVLTASCPAGTLTVVADSPDPDSFTHTLINEEGEDEGDDFGGGSSFQIIPTSLNTLSDSLEGVLTYANTSGSVVSMTFAGEEGGGTPNDPDCSFYGNAIGG